MNELAHSWNGVHFTGIGIEVGVEFIRERMNLINGAQWNLSKLGQVSTPFSGEVKSSKFQRFTTSITISESHVRRLEHNEKRRTTVRNSCSIITGEFKGKHLSCHPITLPYRIISCFSKNSRKEGTEITHLPPFLVKINASTFIPAKNEVISRGVDSSEEFDLIFCSGSSHGVIPDSKTRPLSGESA